MRDRRTDMTKLIGAFRYYAIIAPKCNQLMLYIIIITIIIIIIPVA
jgi:hypothetical protein